MNTSENLRNKAIRVLYLIFLSFIFLYVPADFLSGTKDANLTLEQFLQKHESQFSVYEKLKIAQVQKEGVIITDSALLAAEQVHASILRADSTIESLKVLIDDTLGKGNYGTEQLVYFNIIDLQKDKYLKAQLDSIVYALQAEFPVLADSVNSAWSWDSNYTFVELSPLQFSQFYFAETPAAAAAVNLTSFLYRHRLLSDRLISHALQTTLLNLSLDKIESVVAASDTVVSEAYLSKLLQSYVTENVQVNEAPRNRIEASLQEAVIFRGETIEFTSLAKNQGATFIRVKRDGKTIDSAKVDGSYPYTLNKTGKHKFEVTQGNVTEEFTYQCIARPVSQIEYLAAYPEMTFSLNAYLPDDFDPSLHAIEAVNTYFYSSNNKHYLKLSQDEGYAHLIIRDKAGKEQVLEKRFIIRKPVFELALNNTKDGDLITQNHLTRVKNVHLSFESFFNQESIYLQSFDVQLLYNKNRMLSKTLRNAGTQLNPPVLNLLRQAQTGDQIIFKNIRCITSRGLTLNLNSTILTVE